MFWKKNKLIKTFRTPVVTHILKLRVRILPNPPSPKVTRATLQTCFNRKTEGYNKHARLLLQLHGVHNCFEIIIVTFADLHNCHTSMYCTENYIITIIYVARLNFSCCKFLAQLDAYIKMCSSLSTLQQQLFSELNLRTHWSNITPNLHNG